MAKVRYVGPMDPDGMRAHLPNGEVRFVSGMTGTVIEIPDEYVENFTHPGAESTIWVPSDQAAKDIHQKLVDAAAPPTVEVEEVEYEDMGVAALSSIAEVRGLPKSGTKAELAERLRKHDAEHATTEEN